MAGRLIDGVPHVRLRNDNALKCLSFEDQVYFTLRDIFWNGDVRDCYAATYYHELLSKGVKLEERDSQFKYANLLRENHSTYLQDLLRWLDIRFASKENGFVFAPLEDGAARNLQGYVTYDDWWNQLQELREKLRQRLKKIQKEEIDSELGGGCNEG